MRVGQVDAMLLKTYEAPNGPLGWDHPCLQTSHVSLLQKHRQFDWTFDCPVVGWVALFFTTLVIAFLHHREAGGEGTAIPMAPKVTQVGGAGQHLAGHPKQLSKKPIVRKN